MVSRCVMHQGKYCESSCYCFRPLCLLFADEIWMKWCLLFIFFQWQSKKMHTRQNTLWCFLHIFYTSGMKYCLSKCLDTLYCQVVFTFPVTKQKKQWEDLTGKIIHYLFHVTSTSQNLCQRLMSNAKYSGIILTAAPNHTDHSSYFGISKQRNMYHCLNNNS